MNIAELKKFVESKITYTPLSDWGRGYKYAMRKVKCKLNEIKEESNMKLKVDLFRYKTLVFGEVVYQDESLRKKDLTITSNENYKIVSRGYPEIQGFYNTLCLRGNDNHRDNCVMKCNFNTEEEAIEYCKNIKELIDEINKEEPKVECPVVKEI